MSHASIPAEIRKARQLPEDVIRLCVGIEDGDDLLEDLDRALRIAGCPSAASLSSPTLSPSIVQ
jgi:cystathionine beta-lyase